jgi:predicted DNA-binding protein (MmcQ/YjbR family)
MRRTDVIAYCLAKPGSYLDNPWGEEDPVVKVGGKIFCFLGAHDGPAGLSVKNTRDGVAEWRSRYPAHISFAPYLHKQLWSRVLIDTTGAPSTDEVAELIDDSYEIVVASLPKSRRPA